MTNRANPLERFILRSPVTVRQLLERLNEVGTGFVMVVDSTGTLEGTFTDGDARRLYLEEIDLDSAVDFSTRAKPITARLGTPTDEIFGTVSQGVRYLPILDSHGVVVDLAGADKTRRVPIAQPSIGQAELSNVLQCFHSGWISSQGPFIAQFERDFASQTASNFALAVSNGTVAIQLALSALDLKPGDEVIVPNLTFAATINAVIAVGGIPKLVDVDDETWTISPDEIEKAVNRRTRAILPVHLYGQPVRCEQISSIAESKSLFVVGDAAEALGASYCGKPIGSQFRASTFSFFANKQITTGEGGMITFGDEKDFLVARSLRDHGMSRTRRYWHDHAGFNYRMTNVQAAIGVAQLSRFDTFQLRRRAIFDYYDSILSGHPRVRLLPKMTWSTNSLWLYTIRIRGANEITRDSVISKMSQRGFELRPGFYALNKMKPYERFSQESLPVSEQMSLELVSLPSYYDMDDSTVRELAESLILTLEEVL